VHDERDGAGHFVVEDDPERYGAELERFLSGIAGD